MKSDGFLPIKISENIDNHIPFVALSDIHPKDTFEIWTEKNWEQMKKKNSEKSVDSYQPVW